MASQTTNIAITGHQDLRAEDLPKIEEKVREKLTEILNGRSAGEFSLLQCNAEGADQLVAELAKSMGIAVIDAKKEVFPQKEILEKADYEVLGKYLIENSNHLIALWDGIYNYKKGGTSEVVRMAMEGNHSLILHHLVTPRQENPYPVASLLQEGLSFANKKFQRIPFTVHFSWIDIIITPASKDNFITGYFKNIYQKLQTEVFMQFVLPMILVSLTLILGTQGFMQRDGNADWQNALFKAVNLITFNNSVIDDYIPLKLNIARFLGLLTTLSAFVVGLYLVLGNERRRLKIIFWARFWARFNPQKYVLVLGLSEKSYDLVKDLLNKGKNVAVLAPNDDSTYKDEIEKLGAVFIKGDIYRASMLRKLYLNKASAIYILSDNDTDNVRAMQELEQISDNKHQANQIDRYVHIQDTRQRNFLYDNLTKETNYRSNIFNIYENIARRLLLYHPTDRFYQTPKAKTACIIILGFGDLGKQIALTCLRQGHFESDKRLIIKVLCDNHIAEQDEFKKAYPFIEANPDDKEHPYLEIIKKDIWQHTTIEFFELPKSDADLLVSDSTIFKEILAENIVTIYACLENGLESAAYLTSMLPKLNYESKQHNCNLQVFCFYNFPDKLEEKFIESNFNQLAPNIPVYCFGNFIDECSLEAIHNLALDALPKQIAYWYEQDYGDKSKTLEDTWRDCPEHDKEANRQAADHLWVKVRTIWHAIDWEFDPETFEPTMPKSDYKKYVDILSEIEHRRWCADILLKGFRPLQDEVNAAELEGFWHNGGKKVLKPQKLHLDLKPFEALSPHEKQKDVSQIEKIPEFLVAIVETKKEKCTE